MKILTTIKNFDRGKSYSDTATPQPNKKIIPVYLTSGLTDERYISFWQEVDLNDNRTEIDGGWD